MISMFWKVILHKKMKKKLDRLLRFKTENIQNLKSSEKTQRKHCIRISGTFSIKKMDQRKPTQSQRLPFAQKNLNMTSSLLKTSKTKFRVQQKHYDDKLNKSLKFDKQSKASRKLIPNLLQKQSILSVLKHQVQFYQKSHEKSLELLQKILCICQQLVEQVFSYSKIENFIKYLNSTLKQLGSKSLIFLGYCLSAQQLCIYGSYSLAIFYSDKALKLLGQKGQIHNFERQKQIDLYRTITKIFLVKNQFKLAKQFGYKYLRKAWYLKNYQKQVDAYDLLGKIYHECEQKHMSIYFHNRMCKGQREDIEIIRISNYQMQKSQKELSQFAVYQTIDIFVKPDIIFHQMLQDRYKMKNRSYELQNMQTSNNFYFHTHRSPNRNLNTFRILERRMIEQKKSKQLHFIKPKQKGNLKKMIQEFSQTIKMLQDQLIGDDDEFIETKHFFNDFVFELG